MADDDYNDMDMGSVFSPSLALLLHISRILESPYLDLMVSQSPGEIEYFSCSCTETFIHFRLVLVYLPAVLRFELYLFLYTPFLGNYLDNSLLVCFIGAVQSQNVWIRW
jgi:hypothetical protein